MNYPNYSYILNQLYLKTNMYIKIKLDDKLQEIAISLIEKDMWGHLIPTIVINPLLMPNNKNIQAHILAHEYGHHYYKHIRDCDISKEEYNIRELEADLFASNFVYNYSYNLYDIYNFHINCNTPITKDRLQIITDIINNNKNNNKIDLYNMYNKTYK